MNVFSESFVQWLCSGLTPDERNEKLKTMGAKYIKIDVGDLLTVEDDMVGMIISTYKVFAPAVPARQRLEGLYGSPSYSSAIPLPTPMDRVKMRMKNRVKEPVYKVSFPTTGRIETYYARDIAQNVRSGKWKLFKKENSYEK